MNTVLITGALGGIGKGLIEHLYKKKINVVVNYRNEKKAAEYKEKLEEFDFDMDKVLFFKADVTKYDEMEEMFEKAREKFGQVDGLINLASINKDEYIEDMDPETWQKVIDVNLTGVFYASKLYAGQYKGNKGCIINLSSGTAVHGRAKGANYCSSKAGVINLTKDFAIEYAPNIRTNCIGLGMTMTDEIYYRYDLDKPENVEAINKEIPLGYIGDVSDVVEMIDFLLFKGSYITGQLIYVNGGMYMH